MKKFKIFASSLALALASAIFVHPAAAQTAVSAPVATQQLSPKPVWMKAEVIHFDADTIVVSEVGNERMIHTFTYSSKLHPQMQQKMDKGGYQYGDQVKIRYMQGQTIALAIHGKNSKPANPNPTPRRPTPAAS
jgi:hypothetical protein